MSESDDSQPTDGQRSYQYGRVIDEKYAVFNTLVSSGRHLDGKATTHLQAGSLILALSAAVGISDFTSAGLVGVSLAAAIISVLAFIAMLALSLRSLSPSDLEVLGNTKTWEHFYDKYIELEQSHCDAQVLRDLYNAINILIERDKTKAELVTWSTRLLIVQVVGIAIAAFLS